MSNNYKVYAGPTARSDISADSVPTSSKFNAGTPIYASQVGAIERQNALLLNAICETINWSPTMNASAADNASSFLDALQAYLITNAGVALNKTTDDANGDLLKIKSGNKISDTGVNVTNAQCAKQFKYQLRLTPSELEVTTDIKTTLLSDVYVNSKISSSVTLTPSANSFTLHADKPDISATNRTQTVTVNMPGIKIEGSTLYITKTNVD